MVRGGAGAGGGKGGGGKHVDHREREARGCEIVGVSVGVCTRGRV